MIKMASKREQIEILLKQGMTKAQVAKEVKTHYSYVHSVEKMMGTSKEPTTPYQPNSTSQKIRDMWDQGASRAQISRALKIDYSFVFNVLKAYTIRKGNEDVEEGQQRTKEVQMPMDKNSRT
jgi:DNA invertase Pin-like site-specific DNA recombinase